MRDRVSTPTPGAEVPAHTPFGPGLGLLLMAVIWAINFSVIKIALAELPPLAYNALRFPLASLAVFLILRARGPIPLPGRRDVPAIVVLGVLGNIVYQIFFIVGLDRTRAGNAAILLAGTPIVVALLSAVLGHERVTPRTWTGVIATVVGMGLVVVGGGAGLEIGLDTLAGDLTMVAASIAWSIYTVGAKAPIARYGSVPVTAWTLWVGTLGVVLIGLPALVRLEWSTVQPVAWLGVAYGGGLGIGLAYVLWYRGVGAIGNTRTATYSNLVPVLALVVAWLLLGEIPGASQVLGAAVIITGITLARG